MSFFVSAALKRNSPAERAARPITAWSLRVLSRDFPLSKSLAASFSPPTASMLLTATKGWVYGWKKKGWIKSDKKPALNVDLWEKLLPLLEKHDVTFNWVKGHAGHPENERCDRLAVAQRDIYSLK